MSGNRKKALLIAFDVLLLFGVLLLGPMAALMRSCLPDCMFYELGILCPACGGTRCIEALVRLDFGAAFLAHPIVFLTVFYLLFLVLLLNTAYLFDLASAKGILKKTANIRVLYSFVIAFAVFGVLRNFI